MARVKNGPKLGLKRPVRYSLSSQKVLKGSMLCYNIHLIELSNIVFFAFFLFLSFFVFFFFQYLGLNSGPVHAKLGKSSIS
jgi:hypothetical protein